MKAEADKIPPNSRDSELAVIGAMLLDPQEAIPSIIDVFKGRQDIFYDHTNLCLYEIIMAMYAESKPIDILTVFEEAKNKVNLESLGGISYLNSIQSASPTSNFVDHYARILVGLKLRRDLIRTAADISEDAYSNLDSMSCLRESEKKIMDLGVSMESGLDPDVRAITVEVLADMEAALENQGHIRGLQTGFNNFDWLVFGLKPGQLVILAARPSVGKSAFAMNIAEHVAVDQRIPVGVFSLEMTAKDLIHRMTCSKAGVDSSRAEEGKFCDNDFPKITSATSRIASSPLHICEQSGMTVWQLQSKARRMAQRHGIKLLIVDYLQLMVSKVKGNRNEQITEISNNLKTLAKDLKIPIIAISQLNRDLERENRAPRMSDLRDSGSIEQDADIIMLLAPVVPENGEIPDYQKVAILVPKNRGGRVGKLYFKFNRPTTRFETSENWDRPVS